jgi:septal ring factor EnvC (AmiA/AmiB activator)
MIKRLEKKRVPKSIIGKGFRASKGHLPWPVTGKVLIPFGKYKDPKFNIPVFKNGIEIKAKAGEHPKAAYGGRIVFADWFKGYGLLLIINHGNGYHSLYGNLSEIFHKTGDIINKGTAIGTIGAPRLMDVSTLYFEIRYKGRPVDPQIWLKRKWKGKRKKRRLTKRK